MTTFSERSLPIEKVPPVLTQHVNNLQAAGVVTSFHRYISHSTSASDFYWGRFYADLFNDTVAPRRDMEIIRLRLAAQSGCSFCRAHDISSALECGVSKQTIDSLFESWQQPFEISSLDKRDQVLAALADSISPFTPVVPMDNELTQLLSGLYSDEELAEILMVTAVLAGVGAMLVAAGFVPSECEII